MCVCLSASVETSLRPPSSLHPSSRLSKHRRSLSDTLIFRSLQQQEKEKREKASGNAVLQYYVDDSGLHMTKTISITLTTDSPKLEICSSPSSSYSPVLFNIPVPPPLPPNSSNVSNPLTIPVPPPLPNLTKPQLQIAIPIKESIKKYKLDNDEPSTPPSTPPSPTTVPQTPSPSQMRMFTCSVCFEEVKFLDSFAFVPCQHRYCHECVREHLKAIVSIGKNPACMSPSCKSLFSADKASLLMDEKTRDRFTLIVKTPPGAHRWCPRAGCDTPFIKADVSSSSPKVTCKNPGCELLFCYNCRIVWHEGETCEEFKARQDKNKTAEETLSETYAKQNLQECPNCNIWVEKIDGCEYVQCFACQHEFCWDCLEPHDHNMGAHVHGPNYKPHPYQPYRRRRGRAVRAAQYAGIGVAACVLGPPALAIGAVAAAVVLPALWIRKAVKIVNIRRKRRKANTDFRDWAVREKQRRQDLGLEVSAYLDTLIQE